MSLRDLWRLQSVTRSGAAFVLAIALVAGAAFVSANNLLFLILAAMVSTFLVSGFVGRLGLAGLELDLLLPQRTSARRTVQAGVRVKNLKRYMPSFSIHLAFNRQPEGPLVPLMYFPLIPGGAVIEEPMELFFPRRGAYKQRDVQFSTRFPFGFVERREDVTLRHEVIVYPCLDPRPGFEELVESVSAEIATLERGLGSDFYSLRPYEVSESSRHVDWKATAHTGALQVREFAREQDHTVVIYLDLEVPAGAEAWFEAAIECAAFLVFEWTQRGVPVRFLTQDLDVTTLGLPDIYTVLKYLALISPTKGKPQRAPDGKNFHIVFTHDPEQLRALGWCREDATGSRLFGPDFA